MLVKEINSHTDWITKQRECISSICKKDWKYVDIGACRGEVLGALIESMDEGWVFEPDPNNYRSLKDGIDNLNLPDSKKITLENLAVSNKESESKFYPNGSHMGSLSSVSLDGKTEYTNYIYVKTVSLDNYFQDKKLDFIKMDVEGHEWEIFEGAENLLSQDIIWQVEFHETPTSDWNNINKIYDLGYRLFDLDFNLLPKSSSRIYNGFLSKFNINDLIKK